MTKPTDSIKNLIAQLTQLSDAERNALLSQVKSVDKVLSKNEFKISRILKDKNIAINVLNTTISELETANEELSKRKEKLRKQKEIIEEKSATLADNLRKLELSYREMEQFAYIASHDLKSPLRTISNFAQLLKRRYQDKLGDDAKEYINYIVSGTVQMHEVICDSLEYAQVDKNKEKFTSFDLNDAINMVMLNLKSEVEKNGAQIYSTQLPSIDANRTSVVQLFQNLISNAIKFRGEETPEIHIDWRKSEEGYEFRVSDNGIGIDTCFKRKIFLPFQRLEVNNRPGSGIGLAICKKIVNMHGGEITFESELGKGSTFIFTLYPQEVGKVATSSVSSRNA